jgi:hypothetical protein
MLLHQPGIYSFLVKSTASQGFKTVQIEEGKEEVPTRPSVIRFEFAVRKEDGFYMSSREAGHFSLLEELSKPQSEEQEKIVAWKVIGDRVVEFEVSLKQDARFFSLS